jgi:hypothetical protein
VFWTASFRCYVCVSSILRKRFCAQCHSVGQYVSKVAYDFHMQTFRIRIASPRMTATCDIYQRTPTKRHCRITPFVTTGKPTVRARSGQGQSCFCSRQYRAVIATVGLMCAAVHIGNCLTGWWLKRDCTYRG